MVVSGDVVNFPVVVVVGYGVSRRGAVTVLGVQQRFDVPGASRLVW